MGRLRVGALIDRRIAKIIAGVDEIEGFVLGR